VEQRFWFMGRGHRFDADLGCGENVIVVSEKAFAFLAHLKELGLIDDAMEDEILNRLMTTEEQQVEFNSMKATAATIIFEHQFDLSEEYFGIFEEEWKMLFN